MPDYRHLRLVSQARPLRWNELSTYEQELIATQIEPWFKDVLSDRKPDDYDVEGHRSGRVLFINGPRGAGKTSFLLTLLDRWRSGRRDEGEPEPTKNVHVLFPVLDFDPLPPDMPIHGWLLEPWRRLLERADFSEVREDLQEKLADLFERVVVGWTPAPPDGGVVQRALNYREKSSGWIDTPTIWRKFVDSVVCQSCGCRAEKCRGHRRIYVVPIDDVDLQVEQIPRLLHAIRLLRHSNVVYALTGDYDHIRLVVQLDYESRHRRVQCGRASVDDANDADQTATLGADRRGPTADDIRQESAKLRAALLEKILPFHAKIDLPLLTLTQVGALVACDKKVSVQLATRGVSKTWKTSSSADERTLEHMVGDLRLVTARKAQHAIDRSLVEGDSESETRELRFLAILCGMTLELSNGTSAPPPASPAGSADGEQAQIGGTVVPTAQPAPPPPILQVSGSATTVVGSILHRWAGDSLTVVLHQRPRFRFVDFEKGEVWTGDEANRSVVAQLLVEQHRAQAPGLSWNPDAGILTTEVTWRPGRVGVSNTATFHWPWLVRLTAEQVLRLGELAVDLRTKSPQGTVNNITEEMLYAWLFKNIEWRAHMPLSDGSAANIDSSVFSLGKHSSQSWSERFAEALKKLQEGHKELQADLADWGLQLVVMTTPYFGLPTELATKLRAAVQGVLTATKDPKKLAHEQRKVVGDAIAQGGAVNLSKSDMDESVNVFLSYRAVRLNESQKELWIEPADTAAGTPPSNQ